MTDLCRDPLPAAVRPGRLSEAEIDALLERRLIASLATVGADGTPRVFGMWFRRDGDRILLPTSGHTRKARDLERHSRAAVMIDESKAGLDLRGVMVRGAATLIGGSRARELNRSIHLRYVTEQGLEQPEVARYLTSGDDTTIVVAMEDVVSWDLAAGEAGRALAAADGSRPLDA